MSEQPLRVGVIGLGIGRAHVSNYGKADGCEVMAVCDTDAERLDASAAEHGVPNKFAEVDHLLDSGLVDAVSVCTPNAFHAPISIAALKRGLHVLCEKPMAMNTAEAQSMIDAADEAGKLLGIHFNHRANPYIHALRQYATAGDLGELYFGRVTWHRRRGIPSGPASSRRSRPAAGR